MNKVLHSEDNFIIGKEEGYLKIKFSRTRVTIQDSLKEFNLIKYYSNKHSIDKLMMAFLVTPIIADNYTQLFANELSEEDLTFFYNVKIAVVSPKKYFKMLQLHVQFAKSANVEIDIFQTMKEAKKWLKTR